MQIEHLEIAELLKKTPIFGHLDPARINRLAGMFRIAFFRQGEVIFKPGDVSDTMFIVCEGCVQLDPDRNDNALSHVKMNRGDFFGEEALWVDDPRFYQAVACGDVALIGLNVDRYLAIYEDLPEIETILEVSVKSRRLSMEVPLSWVGEDEFIHIISRRHPAMLWARLMLPIGLGLLAVLASVLMLWLPSHQYAWLVLGIGLPLATVWSIWTFFDWRNDYFILTNKRVVWIEKVALIYDSRQEAPLRTIMSVGTQKSRLGSLLGYADVVVLTYVGTIRLHDLANVEIIAALIESYWHRSEERNRREEALIMNRKLQEKLEFQTSPEETTQTAFKAPQRAQAQASIPQKEPGFFEWLFSDFIRLRYEASGTITYRKHWFVLIRMAWLPVLLMGLAVAAMILLMGGAITFIPITTGLIGLGVLMFFDFLWILYQYADWRNDIFKVTLDQILDIDRKPFGKERRRSAPLENVLSIEYERRGFWGYLFNFGTVFISVGNTKLTFDYVYNPSEVQQDIFYRMGERLDQIRQFEIEAERERISEWIASYHQKTFGARRNIDPQNGEYNHPTQGEDI